jgi:hypothetical protein
MLISKSPRFIREPGCVRPSKAEKPYRSAFPLISAMMAFVKQSTATNAGIIVKDVVRSSIRMEGERDHVYDGGLEP